MGKYDADFKVWTLGDFLAKELMRTDWSGEDKLSMTPEVENGVTVDVAVDAAVATSISTRGDRPPPHQSMKIIFESTLKALNELFDFSSIGDDVRYFLCSFL